MTFCTRDLQVCTSSSRNLSEMGFFAPASVQVPVLSLYLLTRITLLSALIITSCKVCTKNLSRCSTCFNSSYNSQNLLRRPLQLRQSGTMISTLSDSFPSKNVAEVMLKIFRKSSLRWLEMFWKEHSRMVQSSARHKTQVPFVFTENTCFKCTSIVFTKFWLLENKKGNDKC